MLFDINFSDILAVSQGGRNKSKNKQMGPAAAAASAAAAAAAAKSHQSYPTVGPHRRQPNRLLCP